MGVGRTQDRRCLQCHEGQAVGGGEPWRTQVQAGSHGCTPAQCRKLKGEARRDSPPSFLSAHSRAHVTPESSDFLGPQMSTSHLGQSGTLPGKQELSAHRLGKMECDFLPAGLLGASMLLRMPPGHGLRGQHCALDKKTLPLTRPPPPIWPAHLRLAQVGAGWPGQGPPACF